MGPEIAEDKMPRFTVDEVLSLQPSAQSHSIEVAEIILCKYCLPAKQ